MRKMLSLLCVLVGLGACSSDPESPTPQDMSIAQDMKAPVDMRATTDMKPTPDMPEDMVTADMRDMALADMGPDDMNVDVDMTAAAGFGLLNGDCNVLGAPQLEGDMYFAFYNALDFAMDPFDAADVAALSEGAARIYNEPNAGGSSRESEAFAYEVLHRCEGASLLKTENEITYSMQGKITDLLVQIDGLKIGVSVARAFAFMRPYTAADAKSLLDKKLGGINESSMLVSAEDKWRKQILSILVYDMQTLSLLKEAIAQADPVLRADTIILVTLTHGQDCWIYTTSSQCMASE